MCGHVCGCVCSQTYVYVGMFACVGGACMCEHACVYVLVHVCLVVHVYCVCVCEHACVCVCVGVCMFGYVCLLCVYICLLVCHLLSLTTALWWTVHLSGLPPCVAAVAQVPQYVPVRRRGESLARLSVFRYGVEVSH